nr:MAG TPA: hypothetical protein [Caudoviricetes sp.]
MPYGWRCVANIVEQYRVTKKQVRMPSYVVIHSVKGT